VKAREQEQLRVLGLVPMQVPVQTIVSMQPEGRGVLHPSDAAPVSYCWGTSSYILGPDRSTFVQDGQVKHEWTVGQQAWLVAAG